MIITSRSKKLKLFLSFKLFMIQGRRNLFRLNNHKKEKNLIKNMLVL
jgi:hypothetical protein